jgi:hypothetical protein
MQCPKLETLNEIYVLMNHSARVRLTPRLAVGFDAGSRQCVTEALAAELVKAEAASEVKSMGGGTDLTGGPRGNVMEILPKASALELATDKQHRRVRVTAQAGISYRLADGSHEHMRPRESGWLPADIAAKALAHGNALAAPVTGDTYSPMAGLEPRDYGRTEDTAFTALHASVDDLDSHHARVKAEAEAAEHDGRGFIVRHGQRAA